MKPPLDRRKVEFVEDPHSKRSLTRGRAQFEEGFHYEDVIHTNLQKLVLIEGTFCEYTASRESIAPTSITQIEIKGTKIEDYILSRLSPRLTDQESLELVSCFSEFLNHNIKIYMANTAIGTFTLSDDDRNGELYVERDKNPTFNPIVLMAISTTTNNVPAKRYFISVDSAKNDATTEISETVYDAFVNGGVVDPTVIQVNVQSIKRFIMETTASSQRKTLDINLL